MVTFSLCLLKQHLQAFASILVLSLPSCESLNKIIINLEYDLHRKTLSPAQIINLSGYEPKLNVKHQVPHSPQGVLWQA